MHEKKIINSFCNSLIIIPTLLCRDYLIFEIGIEIVFSITVLEDCRMKYPSPTFVSLKNKIKNRINNDKVTSATIV